MIRKIRNLLPPGEVLRFLLVGIVNTVIGGGTMFLLYNLAHCSYLLSSALNYVVGGIVSFFLNRAYTFRPQTRSAGQCVRFAVTIVLCYCFAYGAAKPLAVRLLSGCSIRVQENVALLIGMGVYTVTNFLGQRFFVFRKHKTES